MDLSGPGSIPPCSKVLIFWTNLLRTKDLRSSRPRLVTYFDKWAGLHRQRPHPRSRAKGTVGGCPGKVHGPLSARNASRPLHGLQPPRLRFLCQHHLNREDRRKQNAWVCYDPNWGSLIGWMKSHDRKLSLHNWHYSIFIFQSNRFPNKCSLKHLYKKYLSHYGKLTFTWTRSFYIPNPPLLS